MSSSLRENLLPQFSTGHWCGFSAGDFFSGFGLLGVLLLAVLFCALDLRFVPALKDG